MRERQPKTQLRERLAAKALAVAVGGLALAGCSAQEAPPQPTTVEAPAKSPEQQVQDKVREDAAAATKLVGNLLAKTGGQSVYEGQVVDNYGDSEAAPTDKPGLSVTRNAQANEVTVLVTNSEGPGFRLQYYVADSDPLMQGPMTTGSLENGPQSGNIEVLSASVIGDKEYPMIGTDSGHLVTYSEQGTAVPMDTRAADQAAGSMLGSLQLAAGQLEQAGYSGASDALSPEAVEELTH